MSAQRIEFFPTLRQLEEEIPGLVHGFLLRQPGVAVDCERAEAIERLSPRWDEVLAAQGWGQMSLHGAEQVHGAGLAWVDSGQNSQENRLAVPAVDGLLTQERGCLLGILVADCAAVYLVDKRNQRLALVHSGKKGTELGIVTAAVEQLLSQPQARAQDLVAVISPCIAPPDYEVDFGAQIVQQLRACGLQEEQISPPPANTASDLSRYYSYRREKGKTGRMLAVLGLK